MKSIFWIIPSLLTISLNVLAFDEINLDDLEEIGTEHVIDYSMTGGAKLEPWSESRQIEKAFGEYKKDGAIIYKNQTNSLVFWNEVDTEKWLSFNEWRLDAEIKDKNKNWEELYRNNKQVEMVGRIISCRGDCFALRGVNKYRIEYLSQIFEGDELETGENSVMWVFVNDGTIVRISSDSSVSFLELNISLKKSFSRARLNKGHIFWHHRNKEKLENNFSPETDAHNLPLRNIEANQEYFERKIANEKKDIEQLNEVLFLDENAIKSQISKINELREKHKTDLTFSSNSMVVLPNGTINFSDSSIDFFYRPGGKSYFKKRVGTECELVLRGFGELDKKLIENNDWYEISPDGREAHEISEANSTLNILELITKRIKTIELGRELWVQKYTSRIFSVISEKKKLAEWYGYSSWQEDDLNKRIDFLTTDTKRIETANLKSIENLTEKYQNDKNINEESEMKFYHFSLNQYLMGLKKRFAVEKTQVREMSDLQYYLWTLKNGKI